MSFRSALVVIVAVISIAAGPVTSPARANSELPFNWIRYLNSTPWGYSKATDPSDNGSHVMVERFELRMGDCDRNERQDDCN